jgi:hypothetical protein
MAPTSCISDLHSVPKHLQVSNLSRVDLPLRGEGDGLEVIIASAVFVEVFSLVASPLVHIEIAVVGSACRGNIRVACGSYATIASTCKWERWA